MPTSSNVSILITSCAIAIADHDCIGDSFADDAFRTMLSNIANTTSYKSIRTEWVTAYVGARGCSEKSGQNRWAELCLLSGFVKPQSEEAAKKAAQRAAVKAAKPKTSRAARQPIADSHAGPIGGMEAAQAALVALLDTAQREMLAALLNKQYARLSALAEEAFDSSTLQVIEAE